MRHEKERVVREEKRKHGDESRSAEYPRIEARPKNWLVPVILLTLRDLHSYGYKLMEQATAFGFEAINPGTVYRTLRQMEKDGTVNSNWETSRGGPARRMYSITDAGEAASTSGLSRLSNTGGHLTPSSESTL